MAYLSRVIGTGVIGDGLVDGSGRALQKGTVFASREESQWMVRGGNKSSLESYQSTNLLYYSICSRCSEQCSASRLAKDKLSSLQKVSK